MLVYLAWCKPCHLCFWQNSILVQHCSLTKRRTAEHVSCVLFGNGCSHCRPQLSWVVFWCRRDFSLENKFWYLFNTVAFIYFLLYRQIPADRAHTEACVQNSMTFPWLLIQVLNLIIREPALFFFINSKQNCDKNLKFHDLKTFSWIPWLLQAWYTNFKFNGFPWLFLCWPWQSYGTCVNAHYSHQCASSLECSVCSLLLTCLTQWWQISLSISLSWTGWS